MASAFHRDMVGGDIHSLVWQTFASAAARTAVGTYATADVGKLVWQTDNNTFWILINVTSPGSSATPTWIQMNPTSSGSGSRPVSQTLNSAHELVYKFPEGSGNFANTGNQGSGQDIATIGTSLVRRGILGLFGDCVRTQSSGTPLTASTYNPPTNAVTVEVWVRPQTATTNHHVVNKSRLTSGQSGAGSDSGIGLLFTSARNVSFFIYAGGAIREAITTSTDLLLGVWNHLMGTFDGSTLRLYVNGELCASTSYSGTIDYGTPGSWHFGAFPNVGGFGLNGDLADVLVSSVVRDATYAATAFKNGMPGITQAP